MGNVQRFEGLEFATDLTIESEKYRTFLSGVMEAPVDTRSALQTYAPLADKFQKSVIAANETRVKVVAPAGSGKTQTVVNRALDKVKQGMNPSRLLVLTFDNSAASALRTKLESQLLALNLTLDSPPAIRTLNAFGYQILRDYVPDEFRQIPQEYRRRRLIKEVKQALKEKSPERHSALPNKVRDSFYLEYFSLLKNAMFDPRDLNPQELADFVFGRPQSQALFDDPQNPRLVNLAIQALIWMFKAFDLAMADARLMDFDDQKLRAYKSLLARPELAKAIQGKYSEVIVDEFQDINKLDFELLRLISDGATLVVFGDDDQAIYGFRGCTPEYIINLDAHLGVPVQGYELSVNYRCPPNVIAHADRLIRHNSPHRIEKNPIADIKIDADIKVISSVSASIEANVIGSYICKIKGEKEQRKPFGFQNCAVLYRTNAQSLPLQIQFILQGIPYHVREEDSILGNQVLERILSILQLKLAVAAGKPPVGADAVNTIKSYFYYVTPSEEAALDDLFSRRPDFRQAFTSERLTHILPRSSGSGLPSAISDVLAASTLMQTLDVLSKRFKGLYGMIGSLEDVMDERVPLGEIFDMAATFGGGITDFVKTMNQALAWAKNHGAGKDEDSGVSLRTYFKAKGLQWDTVILTTCNEGMIPHRRAPIEEERRLFYVALTRVSANLLVSYVKNVCNNAVPPSRFLTEAGLI